MGVHLGFEVAALGLAYLLFQQDILLRLGHALHQKLFLNQLFSRVLWRNVRAVNAG